MTGPRMKTSGPAAPCTTGSVIGADGGGNA